MKHNTCPLPHVYLTDLCAGCYAEKLADAVKAKAEYENEARFMRESADADENAYYNES